MKTQTIKLIRSNRICLNENSEKAKFEVYKGYTPKVRLKSIMFNKNSSPMGEK